MRFVCSPKFDGASLNLIYENGELRSAATRGDGRVGVDVTHVARIIPSIPLRIPLARRVEIRGEIVIKKKDFHEINSALLESGEPIFANPRNAASGSLKQLDSKIAAKRKLFFIPWGFGLNESDLLSDSLFESLQALASFGFYSTPHMALAHSREEILQHYNLLLGLREQMEMELDGMVVMLDSKMAQSTLGFGVKSPRFAFAYKFPHVEKSTRLLDVLHEVGRSGIITPVAILEPIELSGAVISRATLHNYDQIKQKDIKLNDALIVIRSGEVIPKVIKPIIALRENPAEIVPPDRCPSCNSKVEAKSSNKVRLLFCTNPLCPARAKKIILHFSSRSALNIEGLGERVIEALYDNGLIKSSADLYSLREEQILKLEGFKDKSASNLLSAIASSRGATLDRFILALGIDSIGEAAAKKLAKRFGLKVFCASRDELESLDGFSVQMIDSFLTFIKENKDLIERLLNSVKPVALEYVNTSEGYFVGKNVAITGKFKLPRNIIKSQLESRGAIIKSNVTKAVDVLIYGASPTERKMELARQLGLELMSEETLEYTR